MIKLATAYISNVPSRINLSTMTFRIFIDATQTKRYEIKNRIITMGLKHCFLWTTWKTGCTRLITHGK